MGEKVHLRSFTFPQSSSWVSGQVPSPSEADFHLDCYRTGSGFNLKEWPLRLWVWQVALSFSLSALHHRKYTHHLLSAAISQKASRMKSFRMLSPWSDCHTSLNLLFPP